MQYINKVDKCLDKYTILKIARDYPALYLSWCSQIIVAVEMVAMLTPIVGIISMNIE